MQQANDLRTSQLAGSQPEDTPAATAASNAGLATFLAGLPSTALSETGRHNVCQRFGLTDDELTTVLAACYIALHHKATSGKIGALPSIIMAAHGLADERRELLPIPAAKEFGADALACALSLTGTTRPTLAQLDAALLEMYPVGGPTAASLVAAGWLLPTIDKKGLRLPPLPVAAGASPNSPQRNGRR